MDGGVTVAYFDRFDICAAYRTLENDWHVGGWLRERPSNQRRRESIGVQLLRMGYKAPALTFKQLNENALYVYLHALIQFGMAPRVTPDDETHADIVRYLRAEFDPEWIAENFPGVARVVYLKRMPYEVPGTVNGRPGYTWREGYVVINPTTGGEEYPPVSRGEAYARARELGATQVFIKD